MSAKKTLTMISKQWCSTNYLMKLSEVGRNSALKIKKDVTIKLINDGYYLPHINIPMKSVMIFKNIVLIDPKLVKTATMMKLNLD